MDKVEILETLLIAVIPALLLYLVVRLQGKHDVRKAGKETKDEIERLAKQIELMEKEQEAQQQKQSQTDFGSYQNRLTFEILAKIMESPVEGFRVVENISKLAQTLSSENEQSNNE